MRNHVFAAALLLAACVPTVRAELMGAEKFIKKLAHKPKPIPRAEDGAQVPDKLMADLKKRLPVRIEKKEQALQWLKVLWGLRTNFDGAWADERLEWGKGQCYHAVFSRLP